MLNVLVRTIKRELVVQAPDQSSADIFGFIKATPEVEGPAPLRLDLPVERSHGFLKFDRAAGYAAEGSAAHILSELHRLHFRFTREEFPASPMIHGGTLTTDRGHTVIVGEKGSGKTTLLVHLASLGWPVAGDEHVLVDGSIAIPRPRSLRVKQGTLSHLSTAAAEIVRRSPAMPDWEGSLIYAVEPSAFGTRWLIRPAAVRHLVMLRAHHGARSRIRRLDRNAALELLLPHVILPDSQRAIALAWIGALAGTSGCWELWNGRLEDSQDILYRLLAD